MNAECSTSLSERRILITGASSGIGRAVALRCAALGAVCLLTGRDKQRLVATLEDLPGSGHGMYAMTLAPEGAGELVNWAVHRSGPLHGLAHCAGIEQTIPFRSTSLTDMKELMDINFWTFCTLAQAIVKRASHVAEELSVVVVASVAGLYGAAGKVAYAASKGALISAVKSLAAEFASKKIRFNSVCPGYVNTPMLAQLQSLYGDADRFAEAIGARHPLGIGQPEDVAEAVAWLLSDAARWVTGTAMSIDGGYGVR